MIFWRDGKAGFVGAAKRLIKGVFSFQHSVTSADVVDEPSFGVQALIDGTGQGLEGIITSSGQGVEGLIQNSFAVQAIINIGQSVEGIIDPTGQGVEATFT